MGEAGQAADGTRGVWTSNMECAIFLNGEKCKGGGRCNSLFFAYQIYCNLYIQNIHKIIECCCIKHNIGGTT